MFALSIRQEKTKRLSNLVVGTFLTTSNINETKEWLSTAETPSELIYILTLGKLLVSIGPSTLNQALGGSNGHLRWG